MDTILERAPTLAQASGDHDAAPEHPRLSEFLRRLTELSAECGIGITGNPQLFVREADDIFFAYAADDSSRLILC
jgi:hypothetical protein